MITLRSDLVLVNLALALTDPCTRSSGFKIGSGVDVAVFMPMARSRLLLSFSSLSSDSSPSLRASSGMISGMPTGDPELVNVVMLSVGGTEIKGGSVGIGDTGLNGWRVVGTGVKCVTPEPEV